MRDTIKRQEIEEVEMKKRRKDKKKDRRGKAIEKDVVLSGSGSGAGDENFKFQISTRNRKK